MCTVRGARRVVTEQQQRCRDQLQQQHLPAAWTTSAVHIGGPSAQQRGLAPPAARPVTLRPASCTAASWCPRASSPPRAAAVLLSLVRPPSWSVFAEAGAADPHRPGRQSRPTLLLSATQRVGRQLEPRRLDSQRAELRCLRRQAQRQARQRRLSPSPSVRWLSWTEVQRRRARMWRRWWPVRLARVPQQDVLPRLPRNCATVPLTRGSRLQFPPRPAHLGAAATVSTP